MWFWLNYSFYIATVTGFAATCIFTIDYPKQSGGWYWKMLNFSGIGEGGDFEALHCQPSRNFDRIL